MLAHAYSLLQQQDNSPTPFERLLRRDRAIVGIALLILILLAWLYVERLTDGVALKPDRCAEFACMFLMWAVMMVAMICRRPLQWFCAMHGLAVRLPSIPTPSARPGVLQSAICSYGSDLRLPPPAHNGRSNAPGCLHRWQARAMLMPVSF